jgi:sugar lactone lactonase YvrE
MEHRLVLRLDEAGPSVHADLTGVVPWACNDMIVRDDGTAYVSHFGFDYFGGTTPFAPASVVRVRPDGTADVVAEDLFVPNGMALDRDSTSLVVAEPGASRLTRFRVAGDGSLTDRETFATIEPAPGQSVGPPDGICLDADGAVWMADPIGRRVLRVEAGGAVTEEVPFDQHPLAVALGGADRRTLFVCLAETIDRSRRGEQPKGRIATFPVAVPGEGRP